MIGLYDPENLLTEAYNLRASAAVNPEMSEQYVAKAVRYEELVRLSTDTPVFTENAVAPVDAMAVLRRLARRSQYAK